MRLCCHLPDRMCWECIETWIREHDVPKQFRFNSALKFLEIKMVIGDPDYNTCWIKYVPHDENKTVCFIKKHNNYKEKDKLDFVLKEIITPIHLKALYCRGNNTAKVIEIGIDPYQEYLEPGCIIRESIPYSGNTIIIMSGTS